MNSYILKKSYAILRITGNKHEGDIKIDKDDIERLKLHSWYIKDSTKNGPQYVAAKIHGKMVKIHRFIMKESNSKVLIDHENRDTFDNRKMNLRRATYSQNNLNTKMRSTNKTGVNGVRFSEGQVSTNGKERSSYYEAICTKDGKTATKRFSTSKYGEKEAFALAVEFRNEFDKLHGITTGK